MVSIIVGYRYLELRWIWFLHSHTVTCRVDENACLQWLLAGAWNFASLSSLCIVCEWGGAKNMCQNLIDSDVVQKWERRKTDRCAWKIRCTRPSDEDLECFVFSRTLSKGDGCSTTEISLGSHYATKRFISDAYVDQSHYLISIWWEMNCLWEFSDIHFHR